ncbi:hypothetical protein LTR36_010591 [Oleoguttula mirabilis]|uniref:AAA+ ATPase domain-containing protein n=1 Tax=Oleoguttula mirabilis TaxID=1507867 RepID=A0AAV9JR60_9PEZI|nr:hypothetical protein LTR36_010591 [Oleoguttula mirabilis]
MRPIARQSARLASHSRAASCSRIRQPSVPRSGAPQHTRAFHYSAKRASDARPPGEHNAWLEQQREEQRKVEDGAAKPEQTAETDIAGPKTNGDGRKPTMRRTMRSRRVTDVPKPPPIPDWFLKHNVVLVKDVSPQSAAEEGNRHIVRCVDTDTGHTLFTVPYYDSTPVHAAPGKRVQVDVNGEVVDISVLGISPAFWDTLPKEVQVPWMVRELVTQRAKPPNEVDLEVLGELLVALPRKQQEEVLRIEADNRRVPGLEGGERSSTEQRNPAPRVHLQSTKVPDGLPTSLSRNFFDHMIVPSRTISPPATSDQKGSAFRGLADSGLKGFHPLGYVFLEAEASARAGLSLAREGSPSSSFASNRVDLSLHCPDSDEHDHMDRYVSQLAEAVHANVIRLDANDIEDLTAEYVGQGQDSPGSFSTLGYDVFDGYEAATPGQNTKAFGSSAEDADEFDVDEDEYDEDEDDVDDQPTGGFGSMEDLRKALHDRRSELGKALQGIGIAGITIGKPQIIHAGSGGSRMPPRSMTSSSSSDFVQWDDARLRALLDGLVDAAKQKRAAPVGPEQPEPLRQLSTASKYHHNRLTRTAQLLVGYLSKNAEDAKVPIKLETEKQSQSPDNASSIPPTERTIIHIRDLKDICRSRLGDAVVRELVRVVQKRRRAGESVLVIGTTAQASNNIFMSSPHEAEDFPFRTITVPPLFKNNANDINELTSSADATASKTLKQPAYNRILEINLRHVQSMLRRIKPGHNTDLLAHEARDQMALHGTHLLTEKVLSLDDVQRIVLTAIGLTQSHARSDNVQPIHIALATYITTRVDQVVQQWSSNNRMSKLPKAFKAASKGKDGSDGGDAESGPNRVEEIRGSCNPHETRLLTGVVDATNIKVGFNDVHAPVETIDALKTLTTLSLLRPEAFKYGVLANDRLPGLLLYGPPGTGKTLLAKAVAKESKATVLEVSGAQIYEKYVGEGEKMVRAVFSLAKKLSPCVVFIDEADAIFGSRSSAGNRNTHREIINQFLREWDGMDDHSVFMMVATNRPFDLDDAVLRRLPRRLLVDLPVAKDRESILGIHLKHEALDDSVALGKLAEQTPLYSGSDLKNLCVSAALACVREENEQLASHKGDETFKLPDKRTLNATHFEKAIAEISASISEDMSSLTAIRKFDEQYGDRRGRRKKAGYGFGIGAADGVVDENSVRVRQGSASQERPPPA